MWYLAEILLAEARETGRESYQCEACNVIFDAPTAADAYRKAVAWGLGYAAETPAGMKFLGISHLTTIGTQLGDGVEICGRFFESLDVWDRVAQVVPPMQLLKAIQWEQNQDTPIDELLSPAHIDQLRHRWPD